MQKNSIILTAFSLVGVFERDESPAGADDRCVLPVERLHVAELRVVVDGDVSASDLSQRHQTQVSQLRSVY